MGDPIHTSLQPCTRLPACGSARPWDRAGASRSVCLLLGLCSAPHPGATTCNPIADKLHLKNWKWGNVRNPARRWDAAEDPPSCLHMSVPCLKTKDNLLPPPHSAAHLLLSMFLCGSPHCSPNKQQDHLWSASWRPPDGFPLLSSGGSSQKQAPKHVSLLGHLRLSREVSGHDETS